MLDSAALERIVQVVIDRLRSLVGRGPCPLCGAQGESGASYGPTPEAPPAVGLPVLEHPERLLSEDEVVSYYRRGVRSLQLLPRCLVTPAARDRARDLGVDLFEAENHG